MVVETDAPYLPIKGPAPYKIEELYYCSMACLLANQDWAHVVSARPLVKSPWPRAGSDSQSR